MKFKLIVFFLLVGIVPLAIASFLSYRGGGESLMEAEEQSSASLQDHIFSQLVALRDIKKGQIENYFNDRKTDIDVLTSNILARRKEAFELLDAVQKLKTAQIESFFENTFDELRNIKDDPYTTAVMREFNSVLSSGDIKVGDEKWVQMAAKCDDRFKEVVKNTGWYDLFLINTDGQIVYSATREADLGMNIPQSDLKESSLGRAFAKAKELDNSGIAIGDFQPYAPSGGKYAAFLVAKMHSKSGEHVGYFALQLPTETINEIVQRRNGLGESGETYLVGRIDGKTSYRSDRIVKKGNKIGMSKSGPGINEGIDGGEGRVFKVGSTGALELSAYNHVDVPGLEWVCITSISVEEVLAVKLPGEEEDSLAKFNNEYGFYDLFLIAAEGTCFYSVCHEADYHSNLVSGKFKDSNLGKLVREVIKTKQFGFADFAPYAPSNGDPASFIAKPILDEEGNIEMIVALQMPLDTVNRIMGVRTGMGRTGETY
ncbi:MAG: cache domain-containing protein, partial [Pirellulales bacterium]|nr:cache domain-containing protein [Pirellulales bacterium]